MKNLRRYNIRYKQAIQSWDEALPLGNGKLGCLIYGAEPLKISLDRVDLWDARPHPNTLESGFNYKNLVKLSVSENPEDWAERKRLFEDIYGEYPYPCKITAGRIELDFGKLENVQSELDIGQAIACICHEKGEIELFMHAEKFVGVAKITGEYTMSLHIPDYIVGELHYPKCEIIREKGFTYYTQSTKTAFRYGVVVLEIPKGSETEIYFTIATNKVGDDFIEKAKRELRDVSEIGYESLKQSHIAWWKKYWQKSEISVGDELLEKTYYRSYYLFASCSREGFYPMPLQGVWTADNDRIPPWKGDYHHDTNTQLSYQSFLKANRLPEGKVFIDYLWSTKPQFEKFAKEFYGVNGLIISGVSTIDGKPMGGWAQYSLSPTMTIWAAQSFDEYYLYTGDKQFLKERAYPFFKETGDALLGILEEKDGKLYLSLSTSPEIHNDEPKAYLKPNSNFDLALLRYLYRTIVKYCGILGEDGNKYLSALEKLDDIATIDGVVSLDREERLSVSHRHFSHLMCMYPLHLIDYDTDEHKVLYRETLLDLERLGMGYWVGFSYGMCAQIYAMAENGNAAYEKLRQFADGFVAENGFHLNGDFKNKGYSTFHYRPFTLEALFGYCNALQEMLLQNHRGYIHILPAIPDEWEDRPLDFKNLRCYDGLLVGAKKTDGTTTILFNAPKVMKIKLKNIYGGDVICVSDKRGRRICRETDGFFDVELEKGETRVQAYLGSGL